MQITYYVNVGVPLGEKVGSWLGADVTITAGIDEGSTLVDGDKLGVGLKNREGE